MKYALPLLFYAALATCALCLVWRDRCLRPVGLALALNYTLSNLAFFMVPVAQRPGVFTLAEVMLATVAYCAWLDCRARALVVLVGVSVLSISANVAFAATLGSLYAYNVLTNIFFVLECLIVSGVGIALRVEPSDFAWRSRFRRWFAQPDAAGETP